MDWFGKAISWTVAIGFAMMGVYVGLLILRIAIGVAGFLLGSSIGTIVLAVIMWEWWKRNRDKFEQLF